MSERRGVAVLVSDILDAIEAIQVRTAQLQQAAFLVDDTLLKATLFDLQIIGEAAKRLPVEIRAQHPEISWREIIATRDFIAHGYYRVDPATIWEIVENDLPTLRKQVENIRQELDRESED